MSTKRRLSSTQPRAVVHRQSRESSTWGVKLGSVEDKVFDLWCPGEWARKGEDSSALQALSSACCFWKLSWLDPTGWAGWWCTSLLWQEPQSRYHSSFTLYFPVGHLDWIGSTGKLELEIFLHLWLRATRECCGGRTMACCRYSHY